jgi:hypothetical protein
MLSGNNVLCQNQHNSKFGSGACTTDGDFIPSEPGPLTALLRIHTEPYANRPFTGCPDSDGRVKISVGDTLIAIYDPTTQKPGGTTTNVFQIPVGVRYTIMSEGVNNPPRSFLFEYQLANIQGDCSGANRCSAVMK